MQNTSNSVHWVNANTAETMKGDIDSILKENSSPKKVQQHDDTLHTARAFCKFLQTRSGWLLVFDNADDIRQDFENFIPFHVSGNILFTSRNSRLARLLPKAIEINVGRLPEQEALEMFLAISNRSDVAEERLDGQLVPAKIIRELDSFPLAIVQAASFLRFYNSISGTEYLKYLKDEAERPALLSFSTDYENYNKTVMTTWEMSYESLTNDPKNVDASQLLCLLGFLNPAGVSFQYLHSAHENRDGLLRADLRLSTDYLKDSLSFKLSVDTLVALSLVQRKRIPDDSDILTLHPLVHEWVRVRLDRVHDGYILRDKMLTLSSALAVHQISIDKDFASFERLSWIPRWPMQSSRADLDIAFLYIERARAAIRKCSLEMMLLLCANFLYLQWKKYRIEEEPLRPMLLS